MRIKDIGNINARVLREDTPQDYTFQYIDISSVSSDGQISLSEPMRYDESPSRARRIVKKDDVILSTVRTYLRAIAGIDWDAKDTIASTGFAVISPDKKKDPAYVKYLMSSDAVVDEICKESTGVSYPAISSSRLSAIQIPVVSLKEQKTISAYLDKQINSINERIWLRERELQTLIKLKQSEINSVVTRSLDSTVPMKDSGIPWIGQIPESWELKRVKDLCDFVSRGCTPDYVDDESAYMVMNQATFSKGYVDYSGVRYSSYCKKEAKINKGDLLIASTGGGVLGKVLLFTEDCEQFYADTHVTIVRSSSTPIIAKFLYYYFSTRFEMINALMAKGSTNQTELQRDELLSHFVPAPDIKEMEAICEHLDDRMTHFSSLIANINAQIDKLKLLKKALINEVITGQRPIV